MKCLLIMTFLFINGIENAEHKAGRQSGSILREDDLDSKTKAWLLMVESGKVDDEHMRKITPKSIFIAPLLTSRSNKCKEGYRHDHLGQCVKVIKLDQKAQLELLLKRLSAMYSERNSEEKGLSNISSGPLHFSLPISGESETGKEEDPETATFEAENATTTVDPSLDARNETELEYSGAGPANETTPPEEYPFEGSGSGFGSGWEDPDRNDTTETATLIPDELDYTESTTELTTTEVPYTTDLFESATFQATEQPQREKETKAEPTRVPVEERKKEEQQRPGDRIVFPDSSELSSGRVRPGQNAAAFPVWTANYQYDVRKLPGQQLWWLPQNWRIDEEQRKPAVFKFWSHLPLVHDPSLVGSVGEKVRRPYLQPGSGFQPSTRVPDGYTIELQQPLAGTHRRGRIYNGRRINSEFVQPRRSYHVVR